MDIAKIINSWGWRIKKAGYNQGEFAPKAKVTAGNLSLYLSGKAKPSVRTFEKIEKALKDLGV